MALPETRVNPLRRIVELERENKELRARVEIEHQAAEQARANLRAAFRLAAWGGPPAKGARSHAKG